MNNSEYLKSLDPHELAEWFNAEHVEAKPVGALGRHAEHEMDFEDSREKLEADALNFANSFIRKHNGAISWNDELYRGIVGLLDRQAAITRATEQHEWIAQANGLIHEAQSEAKRLQAELDKRDQGIARLKKRRDELTAEVQHLRELVDSEQADELSELRDENAYLHEMLASIRRMTNGATNGA